MSIQTNYPDLVTQMTGKDTLNGWDVLVSYDETQLNGLLQQRADQMTGLMTMAPFTAKFDDGWDPPTDFVVSINFKNPVLQFQDAAGTITVSMAMSGTYGPVGGTTTKSFPDNLVLVLQTSLVNVSGTFSSNGDFNPDPSTVKDSSEIILVETGSAHPVCIDFQDSIPKFANGAGGTITTDQLAFINSFIGSDIQQHFESQGYKLYITGVSNANAAPSGDVNLTPTSFCFSTVQGDTTNNIPGTLCMWIAVQGGSGNGTHPSQKTTVTFHPDSRDLTPIPGGSSASIIFAHDLMANLFFLPSLNNSSPALGSVTCTSVKGTPGMTFTAALPSQQVTVAAIDDKETYFGGGYQRHLDGLNFNCNSPPANIAITPGIADPYAASASFTYNADGAVKQILNWNWYEWTTGIDGGSSSGQNGTVDMTFQLTGSGQWQNNPGGNGNELNFAFSVPSSFAITAVAEEVAWWQQWFMGGSETIPDSYTNISAPAPSINASFQPLNYFLTTNLLFPGEHVFVADNPVPAVSGAQKGIAVPRDTILTGQVAAKLSAPAPKNATGPLKCSGPLFYYAPLTFKPLSTVKSSTTPISSSLFPPKSGKPVNCNVPDPLEGPKKPRVHNGKKDIPVRKPTNGVSKDVPPDCHHENHHHHYPHHHNGFPNGTHENHHHHHSHHYNGVPNGVPNGTNEIRRNDNATPSKPNGSLNGSLNNHHHKPPASNKSSRDPSTTRTPSSKILRFDDPMRVQNAKLQSPRLLNGSTKTPSPIHDTPLTPSQQLAVKFKEDLLTSPPGPILGEVVMSLGDEDNFPNSYLAVMNKYGYGGLTDEDFSYIMGFDAANILTDASRTAQLTAAKTKKAAVGTGPQAPFDIRLYGAVYNVDEPDSEANKHMIVNPQDGSITYDDAQVDYTTSTDSKGITTVSWVTGTKSFAIVFSSYSVEDNYVVSFNLKFSGTLTIDGKEYTMNGSQYAPRDPWKFFTPDMADATALIGFGIAILSLLTFGVSIYWRYKDTKSKPAEQDEIVNKMIKKFLELSVNDKKKIIDSLQKKTVEAVKRSKPIDVPRYVNERTPLIINEAVTDSDSDDRLISLENSDGIKKKVKENSEDEVEEIVAQGGSSSAYSSLQPWTEAGYFGRDEEEVEVAKATNSLASQVNNQLSSDSSSSEDLLGTLVDKKVAEHNTDVLQKQNDVLEKNLEELGGDIRQTKDEKTQLDQAKEKAEDALANAKPEEKEEIKKEIEDLDKDIEANVKKEKDQEKIQSDTEKDKEEVEKKKKEEEKRRDKASETAETLINNLSE